MAMDIKECIKRFENLEDCKRSTLPAKEHVPKEDSACAFDQNIEPAKIRRCRKKKNTGRKKNVVSDGFYGDDEYEDKEQINLSERKSSYASLSQQSGLTGFSGGVEFNPNAYADDQELFSFGQIVDPDAVIEAFLRKRVLRERDRKPPRGHRQRRRCVSEQELGCHSDIGSPRACKDRQYQVPNRERSLDAGLADSKDGPSDTSFFSSFKSPSGIARELLPIHFYPPSRGLNNRRVRAKSEPVLVANPPSSESFDGNYRSRSRPGSENTRDAQRYDGCHGDDSVIIEDLYQEEPESYAMQWIGRYHKVFYDPQNTLFEPKMPRESQRSSSVPDIVVQQCLPSDGRQRRIHSIGCDKDFQSASRINVPGSAARLVHPSTRTRMLSLGESLSYQDLRTAVLNKTTAQRKDVVCPLTQEYLGIHNGASMSRSDNDSCYNSVSQSFQSQRTHVPAPCACEQFQEHFSCDEILQTNPSSSASLFSGTSSTPLRTASANASVDAHHNEGCTDRYSSDDVHVDMESLGSLELTVNQIQGGENDQRSYHGQRLKIKLIKCGVVTAIFFIVLLCVIFILVREEF